MNVLVGIKMRRVSADESTELSELMGDFGIDRSLVFGINDFVKRFPFAVAQDPFAEIHM